jgi:hypothetical protein
MLYQLWATFKFFYRASELVYPRLKMRAKSCNKNFFDPFIELLDPCLEIRVVVEAELLNDTLDFSKACIELFFNGVTDL